jgi:hypothetical protein
MQPSLDMYHSILGVLYTSYALFIPFFFFSFFFPMGSLRDDGALIAPFLFFPRSSPFTMQAHVDGVRVQREGGVDSRPTQDTTSEVTLEKRYSESESETDNNQSQMKKKKRQETSQHLIVSLTSVPSLVLSQVLAWPNKRNDVMPQTRVARARRPISSSWILVDERVDISPASVPWKMRTMYRPKQSELKNG